jgi:flagellar biosynthesis protein FliR
MFVFDTTQLAHWYGSVFWPLTRILALIATAPLLSHRAIPVRIKVGIGLVIALALAPVVESPPVSGIMEMQGLGALVRNIFVGLSMGFALRLVFVGIELAGQLIGLQIGLSFAGYFNPDMGDAENAISSFMSMLALLMFLSIDGHLMLIYSLSESFRLFPVGGGWTVPVEPMALVHAAGDIFAIAMSISLPILAVMLLINAVLGLMARVAPQLNLFAVGFPLTIVAGLAALTLFLPTLEAPLRAVLQRGLGILPGAG